jgi:hypothetical protein
MNDNYRKERIERLLYELKDAITCNILDNNMDSCALRFYVPKMGQTISCLIEIRISKWKSEESIEINKEDEAR